MNKYKVLLIFLIMLLPINVFANEAVNKLSVSCDDSNKHVGDNVTCTVSATADNVYDSIEFVININSNVFTYVSETFVLDSAFSNFINTTASDLNITDNTVKVVKADGNTNSLVGTVGTFVVNIKNNVVPGTYGILLEQVKYGEQSVENVGNANVVVVSTPAPTVEKGLKTLKVVSGGNMIPPFDKDSNQRTWGVQLDSSDTTKFKLQVEAANAADANTITAVNRDGGATIDLSNDITFKPNDGGSMGIMITVGSGDNVDQYLLVVARPNPEEVGTPTLSSLVVGGTVVKLVKGQLDYTVTLSSSTIKEYTVDATLSDSEHFKFKNTAVLSPHTMSGEQQFTIGIVPKDGNESYGSEIYIITVKKAAEAKGTEKKEEKVPDNPNTGRGSAIVMGLLLVASFAASIYYYKKNINQYN